MLLSRYDSICSIFALCSDKCVQRVNLEKRFSLHETRRGIRNNPPQDLRISKLYYSLPFKKNATSEHHLLPRRQFFSVSSLVHRSELLGVLMLSRARASLYQQE
jgi:hypothetical protein